MGRRRLNRVWLNLFPINKGDIVIVGIRNFNPPLVKVKMEIRDIHYEDKYYPFRGIVLSEGEYKGNRYALSKKHILKVVKKVEQKG